MKTKNGSEICAEDIPSYRLVKLSSGSLVLCDSGQIPIGISGDTYVANTNTCDFDYIDGSAFTVVGAKALAKGADLYPADNGMVTDVAVGKKIGVLLSAITAAGRTGVAYLSGSDGGNDQFATKQFIVAYHEEFITGGAGKFSESADAAEWLKTSVDGDSDGADICKIADDGPGGILQLTCNDKNSDRENLQLNGEAFKLATGKAMFFETAVAIKDVDKCDFFIGLAITDTDIFGGVTDRIGFQNDHDGNIDALIEQDSTEYAADTVNDLTDCAAIANYVDNRVILAWYWDGAGIVKFFVDGALTNTFTDNGTTIVVPDDEAMTPTIEIKILDAAAAVQTAFIDYIDIQSERP